MPTCRDCGDEIIFARHEASGRMCPFNDTGMAYVLDRHGVARWAMTHQPHRCSRAKVDERQAQRLQREAYLKDRQAARDRAFIDPCSRCGSQPGVPCSNLNDLKRRQRGEDVTVRETSWPHPERMPFRPGVDL